MNTTPTQPTDHTEVETIVAAIERGAKRDAPKDDDGDHFLRQDALKTTRAILAEKYDASERELWRTWAPAFFAHTLDALRQQRRRTLNSNRPPFTNGHLKQRARELKLLRSAGRPMPWERAA